MCQARGVFYLSLSFLTTGQLQRRGPATTCGKPILVPLAAAANKYAMDGELLRRDTSGYLIVFFKSTK